MSDVVICAEGLAKAYRLGQIGGGTLREDLQRWWARRRGRPDPWLKIGQLDRGNSTAEMLWALRDVSFDIRQGEVVGIIGHNGAGKSTVLKILARITAPTAGSVKIRGRVGSLLEVGTGFHPELTGRENIYLNGAILGMKRIEIDRRLDEIVDFAEVEAFLDTPVKRYSSGMYVRLAFAVAAALESEILIVDEVLAVGDTRFQKKCLGKMNELSTSRGRTVLFVSHNMAAIQALCTTAMVFERGTMALRGSPTECIRRYIAGKPGSQTILTARTDRQGSGELRIQSIHLFDAAGAELDVVLCGQHVQFALDYVCGEGVRLAGVIVSIQIRTASDVPVFLLHNRLTGQPFPEIPNRGRFVCMIPSLPLAPGSYALTFSVIRHGEYVDLVEDALRFTVTDADFFGSGEVPQGSFGSALVRGDWRVEPTVDSPPTDFGRAASGNGDFPTCVAGPPRG